MTAADMDVARMTYNKTSELNAYLERSGGILELFAFEASLDIRSRVRKLGAHIRRVETLRGCCGRVVAAARRFERAKSNQAQEEKIQQAQACAVPARLRYEHFRAGSNRCLSR